MIVRPPYSNRLPPRPASFLRKSIEADSFELATQNLDANLGAQEDARKSVRRTRKDAGMSTRTSIQCIGRSRTF